MWLRTLPALLLVGLANCGAGKERPAANMSLTSSAFQNGASIPAQYTCDGAKQPPPLAWGTPPHGTKSFALILDDPDAPSGTFRHWAQYDVPANLRALGAGTLPGHTAINEFGAPGYGPPCPPRGNGAHHYRFKLYALDLARLNVGANPKVADVEKEAAKHAITRGDLVGTYERR
jgi:Raf kinase inhibitor-like YbhB/YbcL family protein